MVGLEATLKALADDRQRRQEIAAERRIQETRKESGVENPS